MSTSTRTPVQTLPILAAQSFRPDVPPHSLLQNPSGSPTPAKDEHKPRTSLVLPSPVLPQQPALLHETDAADIAAHETVLPTGKGHSPAAKVIRTVRGW